MVLSVGVWDGFQHAFGGIHRYHSCCDMYDDYCRMDREGKQRGGPKPEEDLSTTHLLEYVLPYVIKITHNVAQPCH